MIFPATIAGSLPKPSWLAEPNKLWPQWRLSGDELAQAAKKIGEAMYKKQQADTSTMGNEQQTTEEKKDEPKEKSKNELA